MVRALLAVVAVAALASCGGGDDAPLPDPTFPQSQANLTSANIVTFASHAGLAARIGATTRLGLSLVTTGSGTLQDPGCSNVQSGPATLTVTPATGDVAGTVAFAGFDRCFGMRLNGSGNANGRLAGAQVDVLALSSSDFSYTLAGQVLHVSGTLTLDWIAQAPDARYTVTINGTVSDRDRTPLFRLDGFVVDSILPAGGDEDVFISGRLTTAEGFVEISRAPLRLKLPLPSVGLQDGSAIFTGQAQVATVEYHGIATPTATLAPK